MLELGKTGTCGVGKGVVPILSDGLVVATVQAKVWRETATAAVGDRSWVFAKNQGVLTGRWAADPADTVRLRARQTSLWRGTWEVDLDGALVQASPISLWKGTRRYALHGRTVAESGTTGGWSPRPTLRFEELLPLDHQVFLLWVESVILRRNTAGMAGAAGVAVVGGVS